MLALDKLEAGLARRLLEDGLEPKLAARLAKAARPLLALEAKRLRKTAIRRAVADSLRPLPVAG
jgi:hypothetical protein